MNVTSLAEEKQNKKKARRISFYVHSGLILVLIFWMLPYNKEKNIDSQYAVQVAFDNQKSSNSTPLQASLGKQRPKTQSVEIIDIKPAEKIEVQEKTPQMPETAPEKTPSPSEPVVTDILEEESEIVAIEDDIVVEEPEPELIEESVPMDIPTSSPGGGSAPSESNLEDVIADIEESTPGESEGIPADFEESSPEEGGGPSSDATVDEPGPGTGEAGEGTGDGENGDDLDDGIGTSDAGDGEYDDSGKGIFGRKVIHRNIGQVLNSAVSKSGKIVMKVCINRRGTVTYVELNELLTTIADRKVIRNAMSAMWDYRYENDQTAPKEECGKFTISIDNFNGIRPIN